MIRRLVRWGLLLSMLGGCNKPLFPIRPDAAIPLGDHDARRSLIGRWKVEFTIDSLRQTATRWGPPRNPALSAMGTLELRDTLATVNYPTRGLRSNLDVDFTPLLQRQVSCYEPGPGLIQAEREDSAVALWFTPGAADCGFGASGKFYGDSVIGGWSETSYGAPIVEGQFRMVRLRGGG